MRHTQARPLIGMLSAALLAVALSGTTAAADEEFEITPEGADWTLLTYTLDDTVTPVPFGVEATMFMDDGDVSGNSGCNTFFGTYELDGSSISFEGDMGTTLALCLDPARTVEDAFTALLPVVDSWSLEETVLSLADASGQVVLTFEEPIVDVTQTGVAALTSELVRLDKRISRTRDDVRELDVPGLRTQVEGLDASVQDLNKRMKNQDTSALEDRVGAVEAAVDDLSRQLSKMRNRQKDLEERMTAVEDELGLSAPPEEEPEEEPAGEPAE
jgi:heat shock protein HslJ/ribosome-associated translation inhibitor RaiA